MLRVVNEYKIQYKGTAKDFEGNTKQNTKEILRIPKQNTKQNKKDMQNVF